MNIIADILIYLFKIGYPECFCCHQKMERRYDSFCSIPRCHRKCDYYVYIESAAANNYYVYDSITLKLIARMSSFSGNMIEGDNTKRCIPYPSSQDEFEKALAKHRKLMKFK